MIKKINDALTQSFEILSGYGKNWRIELVVSSDGQVFKNLQNVNYKTGWFEKDLKRNGITKYVSSEFHIGFNQQNLLKWIYADYLKMIDDKNNSIKQEEK